MLQASNLEILEEALLMEVLGRRIFLEELTLVPPSMEVLHKMVFKIEDRKMFSQGEILWGRKYRGLPGVSKEEAEIEDN